MFCPSQDSWCNSNNISWRVNITKLLIIIQLSSCMESSYILVRKYSVFARDMMTYFVNIIIWGHAVALLVEALCYKPEGSGFDSLRSHWIF
jgi:hypothetical protein